MPYSSFSFFYKKMSCKARIPFIGIRFETVWRLEEGKKMEKIIAELKKVLRFKDSTDVGDLVLIVAKEPQISASYALVTDIERDASRKNEWWHVGLTLLSLPPQKITWTLRIPQFTGMEVFTMGGEQRFVKAVDFGVTPRQPSASDALAAGASKAETKDKPTPVSGAGKPVSFLKRVK